MRRVPAGDVTAAAAPVSAAECLVSVFMARIIFTSGRGAHVPASRNPVEAATRLQLQNQIVAFVLVGHNGGDQVSASECP
jgi:hypothetical protein